MPLSTGTRLGSYEILAPLGAGGMGEVYRAKDTKLKREVALKVLSDAFARDPERMARFQREAEVLAALNHPQIAAIYGLEGNALVMELVEGENLSGPLPMETAILYARQIAEALEYAHEKGIIHRDLKPANVKITPDGMVKVLDFGLAKAIEDQGTPGDPSNSPTLTLGATRVGVIMGTAAYMSPEQASGKTADRRSDIWSFGAVLYEMLSGRRAFEGESVSDTLASVLKLDPDFSAMPAETPGSIRNLIRRCLTKDRKQRLQAIGEARIVLEAPEAVAASPPMGSETRAGFLWWAAVIVLLAISGVALWEWLKPRPPELRAVIRFTTPLQGKGLMPPPAVSRDGSRVAIVVSAGEPIKLRILDQFESRPIPGTEGAFFVCFSPDGQSIAFLSGNGSLKKVPVSGGAALTLAEGLPNAGGPLSWGEDGSILFGSDAGLMRIPLAGGKPENILPVDRKKGEFLFSAPQLLPGGRIVLFTIAGARGIASTQLAALNLQTREKKILLDGVGSGWYAPTGPDPSLGHIVYGLNGSLFAVTFDVNRLQVGSPAPVLDGVMGVGAFTTFGFSDSGTLVYVTGSPLDMGTATLAWVDRKGSERPVAAPSRDYMSSTLRLSPDGGRAVTTIRDAGTLSVDLWLYDLIRGVPTRITFGGINVEPVWTPDGKRLIYGFSNAGQRGELRSVPADSSGSPSTILASDALVSSPASVSPDGKVLLGTRPRARDAVAQGGRDIWTLALEGAPAELKPAPFLESPYNKGQARFSPDGKRVAYASNESGRDEIYVVPYPNTGGKTQISTEGGTAPQWARNGRELFYRSGNRMMAVEVESGAAFRAGAPKMLFERAGLTDGFDVAPDGQRFLVIKPGAAPAQAGELRVVVNWFEELRRRVPLPK